MATPNRPQAPTGRPKPGAPGGLPSMSQTGSKFTKPQAETRPTPTPRAPDWRTNVHGKSPQPSAPDWASALSGDKRDAYIAVYKLFQTYGLETLAPKIFEYVQKGYSADTISLLLQDTAEYKKRFAGNELRRQAGMPVLSASDYLSLENQYRQELREGGMPAGFYDSTDDFTKLIGMDVSPSELQSRISIATNATTLANPSYKQALKQLYGLNDSQIAAYFLDPQKAVPLLQKQAAATAIGAEALKRGLELDAAHLEAYATAGVTATQAAQVYGQIAQTLPDYRTIGHQFGEDVTQAEMETGLFEPGVKGPGVGPESESAKLQRLQSWSRARATGTAGTAAAAFAAGRSGTI